EGLNRTPLETLFQRDRRSPVETSIVVTIPRPCIGRSLSCSIADFNVRRWPPATLPHRWSWGIHPANFPREKHAMSGTGQTLYRRARKVMPGGTQLLSKRPEMFLPEQWPTYFKSAKGAEIVDLDGRTYLDMSYCGIGATILGFADPDVDAAVKRAIDMGSM